MFKKILFLALGVLFLVLFVLETNNSLDPDFGWQLRTGQIILTSGIPRTDPFSYTMPTYPFIEHSWLADVIIAKTFSLLGYFGLAVIFSVLTLVSVGMVLAADKSKLNAIFLAVFFFVGNAFLVFATIRPLVFTWFLFALLLLIVWDKNRLNKWHFLIPFVFLLWANLHGGFVIGLFVYALVIACRSFSQRRLLIVDLAILLVSTLITLVNPYGLNLWREVWLTISSSDLKSGIIEWQSSIGFFEPAVLCIIILTGALVVRYWRKFNLEKIALFIFFVGLGISAIRHLPLLALVCIPLCVEAANFFREDVKKIKYGVDRFNRALFCVLGFGLFLLGVQIFSLWRTGFRSEVTGLVYPVGAVDYLAKHPSSGELFAPYEWAGYLLWQLPGKKDFIDGRMPYWKISGYSAFAEYQKVVGDEVNFQLVFAKYNIDTVLWPVAPKKSVARDTFTQRVDLFLKIEKDGKDLGEGLLEHGWVEVYRDTVAVIYKKPGT